MKKLIITFALAVFFMLLGTSPVMAGNFIKCYTITTGNTKVYNSNSTSSGKKGTIFGSDEIKILEAYSNGFIRVEYPTARGTKEGFILKSDVVISNSTTTRYATAKITTYRRNNTSNTYGSIYKNDTVLIIGTRGNFTQVRYPITGGFKFAWIRNSDANNYLRNSMTVDPTSVSLKVKITNGSLYSDGRAGFNLEGLSSSAQMKAVVYPSNATNQSVTWSSDNTNIVRISSSGYVTPVSYGTTIITARTVNGKTASASVTVKGTGSNISTSKSITSFSQMDARWKDVPYGYSDTACKTRAYLGKGASGNYGSGCGVLALTNAVYYLNGTFIQPSTIASYSLTYGYRVNGVGTSYGLYKSFANNRGSSYGFAWVGEISSWSSLQNYLTSGNVAICGKKGHIMALVNYNKSTGKYLLLDSCPSKNRGTSGTGYVWATQSYLQNTVGIRSDFHILKSTK